MDKDELTTEKRLGDEGLLKLQTGRLCLRPTHGSGTDFCMDDCEPLEGTQCGVIHSSESARTTSGSWADSGRPQPPRGEGFLCCPGWLSPSSNAYRLVG